MAKKVTTLQRPLRSPYGNLNADYTDENDNAWPSVQAYLDSVAARHGAVPKRMVILVDIDGVETEMTNRGQESTSVFVPADRDGGISDAPSDGKAYVRKDEEWVEGVEKSEVDVLSNTINGDTSYEDLTENFVVGYYNNSGTLVTFAATNWRALSVEVEGGETFLIKLKGTNNSEHSAFSAIGYFTESSFVQVMSPSTFVDLEEEYEVPSGATRVVFTTLYNDPNIVYYVKKVNINEGVITRLTKTENGLRQETSRATQADNDLSKEIGAVKRLLFEQIDLFANPELGYYKTDGSWQSVQTNWLSSGKIKVTSGNTLEYSVVKGTSVVSSYGWWDKSGVYHTSDENEGTILITDDIDYIQVSTKATVTDVYSATLEKIVVCAKRKYSFFVPEQIKIVSGNDYRVYPYNAISVNSKDLSLDCWIENTQSSNASMVCCEDGMFIKGKGGNGNVIDHNGVTLTWKVRNYDNDIETIGTSTIVAKTPTNPQSKLYVLPIGDSVTEFPTEGEQEEGFVGGNGRGAWVNEFSRLLNGIGDEIANGGEDGNLSNVEVIGTRGNGAVKHEGRAGWQINTYLTQASVGDVPNAFWNPTTAEFDMQYYLQTNGFSGVTASGSNLVVIIFLNWNNVYSMTSDQFKSKYIEFIDLIHSQVPDARIMILGMNCPPPRLNKTYSGNRIVTTLGIMEQLIRVENALRDIAEERESFVTHQPLLPFFCPSGSYPTIQQRTNLRLADTDTYFSDYVHPNLVGYGQIADIVYNAFCVSYL